MRRQVDGTPNKTNIGANAILAVSLAVSKAGAAAREFYRASTHTHTVTLSRSPHRSRSYTHACTRALSL